jgi:hypothetical protein
LIPFFCVSCAFSRQRGSLHLPDKGARMVRYYGWCSNKMRGIRHRGLPPELIPHRPGVSPPPLKLPSRKWRDLILRVWPVDPLRCPVSRNPMRAIAVIGDGAKPPENRQPLTVDARGPAWQDEAAMNESEKQIPLRSRTGCHPSCLALEAASFGTAAASSRAGQSHMSENPGPHRLLRIIRPPTFF